MKYIYLSLLRIQHYFTKNKFIFVLYAFGIILCAVIMTFLIGNGNVANNHNYSFIFKSYNIGFKVPLEANEIKTKIENYTSDIDYENIFFSSTLPTNQAKFDDDKIIMVDQNWAYDKDDTPKEYFTIGTFLNNDELPNSQYYGRTKFSEQEEQGEDVIIFNYETLMNLSKENFGNVQIENIPFEIIGLTYRTFADSYIPYKTYNDLHFQVNSMLVEMKDLPSSIQDEDIIKSFNNVFGKDNIVIESPYFAIKAQENAYKDNMKSTITVAVITILTFISLMKYMLERSRYETIIFNSVGATSRKLFLIMMLENIFIVIPATIIGILIYNVTKSAFDLFAYAPGYTYTLNDYIFVIIGLMIISIIISLPFYIMCIRKSLISVKNLYTS